ncbi:MAG TPA: PEP-CTERM sorting domain-containing protein [Stellaceae bacterium]|nr:PEP-CTERM sorting domain-containing protein [Stellaceae bacterium]
MSVRLSVAARVAVATAGLVLVAAPAFAGFSGSPPCPVPEPSTLALLGIAIPGAAAWVRRKLS